MIIIDAPMKITRGEPYAWTATVVGQNWTGYTGTVTFRRNAPRPPAVNFANLLTEPDPILVDPVAGSSTGVLTFSLTAAETLLFPALDRMGWFSQARAEIRMTNGTDVQLFQVRVSTADSLT